VAHDILVESIVITRTRQCHLLKYTSQIAKLHPKTLRRSSIRRDTLDVEGKMDKLWASNGRLACRDMKLVEAMNELVYAFWHHNTKTLFNIWDVLT
jgi:hypothetical protein